MLVEAILLTAVVFTSRSVKRDFFAPTTIFMFGCTFTLVSFYLATAHRLFPVWISSFWFLRRDYSDQLLAVAVFYLILVVITYITGNIATRRNPVTNSADWHIDGQRIVDRVLRSKQTFLILFFLVGLCVIHSIAVDISSLLHYDSYLSVRDPAYVGIRNPLIGIIHTNIPMLGVMIAPIVVFHYKNRNWTLFALALLTFVYVFGVTASFASRFAVVQLMFVAATFQLVSDRNIDWRALLSVGFALVTYAAVILMRQTTVADRAGGEFGLIPFVGLLVRAVPFVGNIVLFAFFNMFTGGFLLADAFASTDLVYPLEYKLLSFSPLPSLIDGFAAIRDLAPKPWVYAPYGNFAEAYNFGMPFLLLLVVILAASLYFLTRYWTRTRGALAFVLLCPAYYSLLRMHTYPIRNTFRWLLISVALVFVFDIVLRRFYKRNAKQNSADVRRVTVA